MSNYNISSRASASPQLLLKELQKYEKKYGTEGYLTNTRGQSLTITKNQPSAEATQRTVGLLENLLHENSISKKYIPLSYQAYFHDASNDESIYFSTLSTPIEYQCIYALLSNYFEKSTVFSSDRLTDIATTTDKPIAGIHSKQKALNDHKYEKLRSSPVAKKKANSKVDTNTKTFPLITLKEETTAHHLSKAAQKMLTLSTNPTPLKPIPITAPKPSFTRSRKPAPPIPILKPHSDPFTQSDFNARKSALPTLHKITSTQSTPLLPQSDDSQHNHLHDTTMHSRPVAGLQTKLSISNTSKSQQAYSSTPKSSKKLRRTPPPPPTPNISPIIRAKQEAYSGLSRSAPLPSKLPSKPLLPISPPMTSARSFLPPIRSSEQRTMSYSDIVTQLTLAPTKEHLSTPSNFTSEYFTPSIRLEANTSIYDLEKFHPSLYEFITELHIYITLSDSKYTEILNQENDDLTFRQTLLLGDLCNYAEQIGFQGNYPQLKEASISYNSPNQSKSSDTNQLNITAEDTDSFDEDSPPPSPSSSTHSTEEHQYNLACIQKYYLTNAQRKSSQS